MNQLGKQFAILGLAIAFNGAAHAQDTTSDDKSFLKESAEGNIVEVNYAKLALQKSKDPNVRKFAERMIKDHKMLQAQMKPLALKLGVKLPTGPELGDKAQYTMLNMKKGTEFDRAYVEAMVKDHHGDLQKFMDEETKTANVELKAFVAKGEKVIREHAEMIDGIAHMAGIQTPPMPTT
jgi:putative membrane protein